MAAGDQQLTRGLGFAALGLVLGAAAAGLVPLLVLGWAEGRSSFTPYLWQVLRFTLLQAALSTLLATALGLLAARTLARSQFPGRELLLRLMLLPQALPAIVIVLSLLSLYGNSGILPGLFPVYGLAGILLAHVFFNMPLATRMLLTRYEAIPPEPLRLAQQLRFSPWETFRHVEWPAIASTLKSAAGLIFLLCAASFAIVLVLGGGPQATTLEVAIYQSLRMDFNPGFAALLSLVQVAICTLALLVAGRAAAEPNLLPPPQRTAMATKGRRTSILDMAVLLLVIIVLVPPLVSLLAAGIGHISWSSSLTSALLTSFGVGISAAVLASCLGTVLAAASAASRSPMLRATITLASLACLLLPPAVIATGWFVLLAPHFDVGQLAPALVILLNALVALPFVRAIMEPAIAQSLAAHDRLCRALGISGFARLRLIEWPMLRRPLLLAASLAFIMSLGELAAITLFGNADFVTLPSLIYRQMGHYQMAEAGGTALVLALVSAAFTFVTAPRARSHDHR